MKLNNHVQGRHHELQQVKAHVLGGTPTLDASMAGEFWYDSALGRHRGWDGSAAHNLTNLIEQVIGDGTVVATLTGKRVDLAIGAATGAARGTMSAIDKTKLDGSTNANTPSTLVARDGNGDFAAGTITAALNGLAANATLHGGQTLAQVRDFSLTTGQRLTRSALSDIDAVLAAWRLDQLTAPTTNVSMGGQRLVSLADPVSAGDAATKGYVDGIATGLDPKASVKYGTTAALASCTYANGTAGVGATLTATANGVLGAIGGGTPGVGDRILVKNQASQPQNAIYVVTSVGATGAPWVLTRSTDADSSAEVTGGMFTFVEAGTLAATGWVLNTSGAVTLGTTNLPFVQFSGAGTYGAGNGLSLSGSTFSAVGTAGRISVGAGGIDIDATYVGQTSITTLGTISTGVWSATAIAVAKGGTGATTAAGARTNLAATGKYAGNLGAGSTFLVSHGLNTLDVIAAVVEVSTGDVTLFDVTVVDANNVRVASAYPIADGAYRLVVIG